MTLWEWFVQCGGDAILYQVEASLCLLRRRPVCAARWQHKADYARRQSQWALRALAQGVGR